MSLKLLLRFLCFVSAVALVYSQNTPSAKRLPSPRVYLTVLSAQMGAICLGYEFGWSGSALADMARPESRPHLTDDNASDVDLKSWISSSMNIGGLIGGLFCGLCIDMLGRKKTLIIVGLPYIGGFLLIGLGTEVWLIILGRVLTGISSGIILGTLPAYVMEVSTPNIRGFLGMTFPWFSCMGILAVPVVSLWLPWNYMSLLPIVPAILMMTSMFFMPESPNWLMNKYGRSSAVIKALQALRRPDSDIDQELDELQAMADVKHATDSGFSLSKLKRQDIYKPLLIAFGLVFFLQFMGIDALLFNIVDIFEASGSSLDPQYAVIIVNGGLLLAAIISSFIVDVLGRRIILLVSGCGCCVSLTVLATHYYLTAGTDTSSSLPLICLVVFMMSFNMGFGTVTWVVIPEICNSSAIGLVSSTASVTNWALGFLVSKEFEDLESVAHDYGAFWFFAGISFLSIGFAYSLTETKGKSVDEIQRIYYPKIYKTKTTTSNGNVNDKTYDTVL